MAAELVPITEFPIAEALPAYLEAERIGVNAELIGKIAHWGCFEPDVQIEAYSGQITSHNASVMGFESSGAALMGARGTTEKAPLARHSFEAPKAGEYHLMRSLKIAINTPELQQRLGEQRADLRDPAPWASHLDMGISQQLRAASRKHLLGERSCAQEVLYATGLGCMLYTLGLISSALVTHDFHQELTIPAGVAGALVIDTAIKCYGKKMEGLAMTDACLSVVPGFHIDRYAAVEALTRTRRLVRPIE